MEFLVFVVIGVVATAVTLGSHARARQRWEEFARRNGLEISGLGWGQNPQMFGNYRGVPVTVWREMHGTGKNRHAHTRFSAQFARTVSEGMHITAEGLGDKLAKMFGAQDIQLGVEDADKALRIKGDDPQQVRAFLQDRTVRGTIMAFLAEHRHTGSITANEVVVLERGFQTSPDRLEARLRAVSRVVQAGNRALGAGPAAAPQLEAPPAPAPEDSRRNATPSAPSSFVPAPAAAAPTPASAFAVGGMPEALLSLRDPLLPSSERSVEVEHWKGKRFAVSLDVAGISMTSDMELPPAYRDGRTIAGRTAEGLTVAVCTPKSMDLRALAAGTTVRLECAVHKWDALYGRLVMLG